MRLGQGILPVVVGSVLMLLVGCQTGTDTTTTRAVAAKPGAPVVMVPRFATATPLPAMWARDRLLRVKEMPNNPPSGSQGSSVYWELVQQGPAVHEALLTLMSDMTPTKVETNGMPGAPPTWCVGDMAVVALMDICPDLPVSKLAREPDAQLSEVGFGQYWAYVGASGENREVLQRKLRTWFKANGPTLVWEPRSGHWAGGVWLKPVAPPAPAKGDGSWKPAKTGSN